MTKSERLSKLARIRLEQCPRGYKQPEDFPEKENVRYHFKDFVSPINKACSNLEGVQIMGILQDWSGAEHLNRQGFDQTIQDNGFDPAVQTNLRLRKLLCEIMALEFHQVFFTNALPWIKAGNIGARLLGWRSTRRLACDLLFKQFEIFDPKLVLAFGWHAKRAVRQSQIPSHRIIELRHPARQGIDRLRAEWHKKIIETKKWKPERKLTACEL